MLARNHLIKGQPAKIGDTQHFQRQSVGFGGGFLSHFRTAITGEGWSEAFIGWLN
jgi:hypothetical protein